MSYFTKSIGGSESSWEVFKTKKAAQTAIRKKNKDIIQEHFNGNRNEWLSDPNSLEYILVDSPWDQDPCFPREDWAAECANNETYLGYHDWLELSINESLIN